MLFDVPFVTARNAPPGSNAAALVPAPAENAEPGTAVNDPSPLIVKTATNPPPSGTASVVPSGANANCPVALGTTNGEPLPAISAPLAPYENVDTAPRLTTASS